MGTATTGTFTTQQPQIVVQPGMRLAMEGPRERARQECEALAEMLARGPGKSASCVAPGTMRRP
jgi:hypothetical protein